MAHNTPDKSEEKVIHEDLLAALEERATDKALIQQQLAIIERLSAALEPFAEVANYAAVLKYDDADYVDVAPFTAGDFRKARAALRKDASDE